MPTARELIAQTRLAQPDKYYIRMAGGILDWEEQIGAKTIKVKGWEDCDFFAHWSRGEPYRHVTEGHTGKSVVTRGTLKEAKDVLSAALDAMGQDAFDDAVVQAIFDTGLSPRYKWVEEKQT